MRWGGAWSRDDEFARAWVAIHVPRRLAEVTLGLLALPPDIAVACLAEVVSGIKNDAWQSSALAFIAERIGAGSSPFVVQDIEHPALLPPAYDHVHHAVGALVVEAWNHRLSVVIRSDHVASMQRWLKRVRPLSLPSSRSWPAPTPSPPDHQAAWAQRPPSRRPLFKEAGGAGHRRGRLHLVRPTRPVTRIGAGS